MFVFFFFFTFISLWIKGFKGLPRELDWCHDAGHEQIVPCFSEAYVKVFAFSLSFSNSLPPSPFLSSSQSPFLSSSQSPFISLFLAHYLSRDEPSTWIS
jgi:hypothetical protein